MKYYFSSITRATIFFTLLGFIVTGSLIFNNIRPSNELPKDITLTQDDVDIVTLRFHSRAKLAYDSISVEANKKVPSEKVAASHFFFHYNPQFLVWVILITIMMAIAMGVLPSLADRLLWLKSLFKISKWNIVLILSLAVIIGALFTIVLVKNPYLYSFAQWIGKLEILFKDIWVLQMVIAVPTLSGLLGLVGMIFISISVDRLNPNKDTDSFKEKFHLLNQSLKFFLTIATTLITFAVFTSGALRKAILQEVVVKGIDMIPLEFVYLYGLQFTIVLAIFYLPIYYQLRNKGQVFIKSFEGNSEITDPSIKNIEAFMHESVMDSMKIGISIMAPLLGGILPDLINF